MIFFPSYLAFGYTDITASGSFGSVQNTLPFQEQGLLVEPKLDHDATAEASLNHVARFGISDLQAGIGYTVKTQTAWNYGIRSTLAPGALLIPRTSIEVHGNSTVAPEEEFHTSLRYSLFWNASLWSTSFRMETYRIEHWLFSADLRPSFLRFDGRNTEVLIGLIGRAIYFWSDETRISAWFAPGQEGTVAPNGEQTLVLQTRSFGTSVRLPVARETSLEFGYEFQHRFPSQFRTVSSIFTNLRIRLN
jgi:hypothetical protein